MYLPAQCRSIYSHTPTVYICFSGRRIYLPAQCRSINSRTPTVYICFSGSRMYLPASNGKLCILFIYVSVGVECICQPLMGTCVYCLYMFQWE